MSSRTKRFRVAFSFTGGKRDFVEKVADLLAERFGGEKILYDKYHEAEFARRDLGIYLPDLYREQSDLIVVVLSQDYDDKQWTGLEWTSIHDLLSHRKDDDVLLCRFDRAEVKGLPSTAGFVELDQKTPSELATLILRRLALNESRPSDYYLQRPNRAGTRLTGSDVAPQTGEEAQPDVVDGASLAPPSTRRSPRDLVYISYRHRDKHWQRLLRQILNADGDLKDRIWDDTDIHSSDYFADEIDRHVARARVMIMLTSADYFGPESGAAQCEIQPALEAHAAGLLKILWIPVRRHRYGETPVGEIMAATGAGAIALEDLSPKEQMDALHRVHDEVRRCLGMPVTAKPASKVITGLELVLDRPPETFDESAFRQALEAMMGVAVQRVQIVSIRKGSTIVTLGGDPEALAVAVQTLKEGQERVHDFVRTTGLRSFSWIVGGEIYGVQVSSPTPKVPVESADGSRQLVILIHGIQTRAEWQGRIRALLMKHPGTIVEALGYGHFDVFRFLFPFLTRRGPVKEVTEKVRGALHLHRGSFDEVVIVAHSFASYIVGMMLRENWTIVIDRLLLCGSVLRRNYAWELLPNRPKKVLNEVGSKDIWPILAHSATWGFGSSGTFGFQTFGVRDRYHAIKHSEYFKVGFAEKYWIPWILEGTDVSSSYEAGERPSTPFFKNLLDIIHLKWLAIVVIGLALFFGWRTHPEGSLGYSQPDSLGSSPPIGTDRPMSFPAANLPTVREFPQFFLLRSRKWKDRHLDVQNGKDVGDPVATYYYTNTDNQKWMAVPTGEDGFYYLVTKDAHTRGSTQCLEIEGASSAMGAALVQGTAKKDAFHQHWLFEKTGSISCVIRSRTTMNPIDLPNHELSTRVVMWNYHGGDNQQWEILPAK